MTATGIIQRIRPIFSFKGLFFLIVVCGFFLRFFALDLKLLHHDEAIHAWFACELLIKGVYTYDPMYHGPLLYYLTAGMFALLGQSDLVARLLPALFGALILPLVFAIHRLGYLDRKQALITGLFIAISPDLVYFSRFLRHDIFQIFFTVLILVALLAYLERGKLIYALIAGLATGGGMCLKEDMPLFLVLILMFGIFLLWKQYIPFPRTWKRDILLGILIAVGIMAIFYSSFGFHPEILETGVFKAYTHWASMHGICRICGPWFFYILLFLLYEIPIFCLALFGILQFADRHNPIPGWIARANTWIHTRKGQSDGAEGASKVWGNHLAPVPWDKKELFFLFCVLWFLTTLAAYAYIGEKVPWLIVHQLVPAIFIAVYLMSRKKTVFALAGCVFLILMTWHVAFIPADVNEPIVQVQNSEDMRKVMALIDASDSVVIASEHYWPLPWYYYGDIWNEKMHFYGKRIDEETIFQVNPDMVITHDQSSFVSLQGYEKKTYKLSYWFSIYDNENRIPEYYVKRDGKMGSINIDIFTRPGLYDKAGLTLPVAIV